MLDRLLSIVVAVCLALLVWLYARSRDQEVLDNVPIPVQVTLAPGQEEHFSLEVTGTPQVLVAFTGSPARIRELRGIVQRNELQLSLTVTVPDERKQVSRYVETLRVEPSHIPAPPGITPVMIEGRDRISVAIHRLIERRLPVRFEGPVGDPGMQITLDPPTVLVRGPQEVVERLQAIPTTPSHLPTRPANALPNTPATGRASLVQEIDGRPIETYPDRVLVRVPPQMRKKYDLVDVPIHFLCPSGFVLQPRFSNERAGKITLQLQGPVQETPPQVHAYIDLTRGRFSAGLNHEPLQLQLPNDFTLTQAPPRVIAFELQPPSKE